MPTYNKKKYINLMRPLPTKWPKDIFDIPFIKKSEIDISNLNNGKYLINIENTSSKDKNAPYKIVHSFKFDDILNRLYNNPLKMLEKVGPYYATATLDFSMHPNMATAQIIDATFKNRWSGAFLQSYGYTNVIPTVGWVDEKTYDICFAGIEDGTILLISTMSVHNEESINLFMKGYHEMRKRFPHSQIICLGNKIPGMDDDVCYVDYKDSFGNEDRYKSFVQLRLFNWDFSEVNYDVF